MLLTPDMLASIIQNARKYICYAGPGIQANPAIALAQMVQRLPRAQIAVLLDVSEHAIRLGYGAIDGVRILMKAGIEVQHAAGLRTALLVVDDQGYLLAPTPSNVKGEFASVKWNAIQLTPTQSRKAMARLSNDAKRIAVAQASTDEEREYLSGLAIDVVSRPVEILTLDQIHKNLLANPQNIVDISQTIQIVEIPFQYVELSFKGAQIGNKRIKIPAHIAQLGSESDLNERLTTLYDAIDTNEDISPQEVIDAIAKIREKYLRSLGEHFGAVIHLAHKADFVAAVDSLHGKLEQYQERVFQTLAKSLRESREQITELFTPAVLARPPKELLETLQSKAPPKHAAQDWLRRELDIVFPDARTLLESMQITVLFKGVLLDTCRDEKFRAAILNVYPDMSELDLFSG